MGYHLGSSRLAINGQGQVVHRYDFLPFGEELKAGTGGRGADYEPSTYTYPTTPDDVTRKFTGKDRDWETGLDFFGARCMSSAQGRFTSSDEYKVGGLFDPETGKIAEATGPLPYADVSDPQTINKYSYVRNNVFRYVDPDGHAPSDLTFDGTAHTLTLTSSGGAIAGTWPAFNNVAIHQPAGEGNQGKFTNGPIQDGVYSIVKADQHGATMHLNGSENSAYGPQGIIHIEDAKGATGNIAIGDGIHSGRLDKGSPDAKTAGCIRTCTQAMRTINGLARTDPVKTIAVTNNRQNVDDWRSTLYDPSGRKHRGRIQEGDPH